MTSFHKLKENRGDFVSFGNVFDLPATFVFILLGNRSNGFLDHRSPLRIEKDFGNLCITVFSVHDSVPLPIDLAEFFLIGSIQGSGNLMFLSVVERLGEGEMGG